MTPKENLPRFVKEPEKCKTFREVLGPFSGTITLNSFKL